MDEPDNSGPYPDPTEMDDKGGSPPCFEMMDDEPENPYFDLRNMALNVRGEDIGLGSVPDGTSVFGVVLDVVTEGGSATFTAFRTGDASMYTSNGGGLIGGVGHENIRRAAIALVERAESLLDAFTPADDTTLPAPGQARFYLVTDRGRFFREETVEALFSATCNLPALTQAANALFTELRVLDESSQGKINEVIQVGSR